jgi:hypothetical protein
MTDPFDRLAQQADRPIAPSEEFTHRLWDRLESEFVADSTHPSPASGPSTTVRLGETSPYLDIEQPSSAGPRRPHRRRWPMMTAAGVAASLTLGALIATRINHTSRFKTVRLDPAAAAFLTSLKADDNAYQVTANRWVDTCVSGGVRPNTPLDPTACRQALETLVTTVQTILGHLDAASPSSSLAAPIDQYRRALQAVADAAKRALDAAGTPAFRQANVAVQDTDIAFCGALDQLDAAGHGVVSIGRCPAPRA